MSATAAEISLDNPLVMCKSRRYFVLLSPVAVIGLGHLTAQFFLHLIGKWAWIPLVIEYWFAMTIVIIVSGGFGRVVVAYKKKNRWQWWFVGAVIGLLTWSILLLHRELLNDFRLVILSLLFSFMNPFFEEGYWRGLLGQVTHQWPAFLACLYSSFFFAAGHPLQFGVFSLACRRWDFTIFVLVMGILYSAIYRRTQSLKAVTFSHMLADLGSMSVWVFLNLYVP